MNHFFLFLFACSSPSNDSGTDTATNTNPEDTSTVATECETLPLDECEIHECNLISGYPSVELSTGETCIAWDDEPQPAGCTSMMSSEAVISFAQDENGVCWAFSSGTYPAGWEECASIDECPQ